MRREARGVVSWLPSLQSDKLWWKCSAAAKIRFSLREGGREEQWGKEGESEGAGARRRSVASHGQRGDEKSGLCTMDESSILRRRGLQVGEPDAAVSLCVSLCLHVCVCVRARTGVWGWSGAVTLHRRRSPDSRIRTLRASAVGGRQAGSCLSFFLSFFFSWDSVLRAHPFAEEWLDGGEMGGFIQTGWEQAPANCRIVCKVVSLFQQVLYFYLWGLWWTVGRVMLFFSLRACIRVCACVSLVNWTENPEKKVQKLLQQPQRVKPLLTFCCRHSACRIGTESLELCEVHRTLVIESFATFPILIIPRAELDKNAVPQSSAYFWQKNESLIEWLLHFIQ